MQIKHLGRRLLDAATGNNIVVRDDVDDPEVKVLWNYDAEQRALDEKDEAERARHGDFDHDD